MWAVNLNTVLIFMSYVLLQDILVLSLKCYDNMCGVDDTLGPNCYYEGFGTIYECRDSTGDRETACYEEPYDETKMGNGGIYRQCVYPPKTGRSKDAGCSARHGKRLHMDFACLCFEDLCNNKYNFSLPYYEKVVDGKADRSSYREEGYAT